MLNGLVLAGGQSRRMGQDKALMRYQGKPLFEHAAALLNEAGCKQVLISRNQPGYLTDIIVDAGPLAGVHAALDVLSVGDELVVLPVDMPQMTPALLRSLWQFGRDQQKACFVATRILPFYLPVTHQVKSELHTFLTAQKERKVVRFLNAIHAATFSGYVNEPGNSGDAAWLNVNSPEDWPDET